MRRRIACAVALISLIFFASRQMLEKSAVASETDRADESGRASVTGVQLSGVYDSIRASGRYLRRIEAVASRLTAEFAVRQPQPRRFRARGTAYYPHHSRLQGGYHDRRGRPLRTLQAYLRGRARYVSVAMDIHVFPYGTRLRIRELERKYGRPIEFRVVDTGGAFCPNPLDLAHECRGKGTERIDICVRSRGHIFNPTINGWLTLVVEGENRRVSVAKISDNKGIL